ncbi:MAG: hypothetical protein IJL56_09965 [Bacteroidales bacterium]|nr:hypothetical protein [Bacteroidales bacterium]
MTDYDAFDYVLQLAFQFPEAEVDEETGAVSEMPHYTYFLLEWKKDNIIEELGLSEDSFYKQESIIPVIEAYGLDKEKFWYAVAYVKYLTNIWAKQKNIANRLPPAIEQLTTFRNEIEKQHEFKVLIDNPTESHTFPIAGNRLINLLVQSLDELIEKEKASDYADAREIPIWREEATYKKTEMTWYAANLFKRLFDCLRLPVKRSRGDDNAGISLDKNQLIAELIHFLGLTDNPDLEGNSIKAILKSKKEFGLQIM